MTEEVREENVAELDEGEVLDAVAEEVEVLEASAPDTALLEEEIQRLEEQLAETERQAAEYLDGLQRSQASFANYRKRTEAEQVSWRSVANAALLGRFLPVLDDFARAFQALPQEFAEHPWLGGITLIQRKIAGILESENVTPIDLQPGDAFDPLYHQAILYQEVPGFEDGQVVAEVERGYILGERLLRPAAVVVAKAPYRAPEPEPEVLDVETVAVEDAACCCADEPCECSDVMTEDEACCGEDESCARQDPA